ncbi:MAG: transposase [Bacteriovorax sp.]|nr:transposase [Bacteriovorax sp.]
MKKIRKGFQLKLTNPKNAGRPAIHDQGIRHTKREEISRPRPLHLTIKLIRADIQNKIFLKALRHAIVRARLQGLKIIHYSLEHDHIHLYAESSDNKTLGSGMKALGVSLVKKINIYFKRKGTCYKTRYHLRILRSASEVKNVINYILKNGIKHKRTNSVIDPYNSALVLHDFRIVGMKVKPADNKIVKNEQSLLREVLDELSLFRKELRFI